MKVFEVQFKHKNYVGRGKDMNGVRERGAWRGVE